MNLYSLTINEPTGVTGQAHGNLLSPKSQDLVLIKASEILELYTQDPDTEELELILRNRTFSQIRRIMTYRPVGNPRDYLVVSSDSGKLTVLEVAKDQEEQVYFKVIVSETMGKSGCRRICPGEYLAKDPKGRAIILASVEKNKLIYLTSKSTTSDDFVISSPLEANKAHTIVFDMVGLDVGFENPQFVCLEFLYGDPDDPKADVVTGEAHKWLTFYEIDLGMNHVIKRQSVRADPTSSMILNIGENSNLESGVLLAASREIFYFGMNGQVLNKVRVPIRFETLRFSRFNGLPIPPAVVPGPEEDSGISDDLFMGLANKKLKLNPFPKASAEHLKIEEGLCLEQEREGLMMVNSCFNKHKGMNFYFLQNEWGDLFKLLLVQGHKMELDYLCTAPVAVDMCIFKSGFLFMANEAADHLFLGIQTLNPDRTLVRQIQVTHDSVQKMYFPKPLFDTEEQKGSSIFSEFQSFRNMGGLVQLKYDDLLGDEIGQFYGLTSGPNGSSLRMLRQVAETNDETKVQLEIKPDSLFTLPGLQSDSDAKNYLLLSGDNKTFLLKRNGEKLEQVQDCPIYSKAATVFASVLEIRVGGQNDIELEDEPSNSKKIRAWLQVHTEGFRVIFANGKFEEWKCEGGMRVVQATSVENQILISQFNQELIYLVFADDYYEEMARAALNTEILCMTLYTKENLRQHSTFAVLGLSDKSVRVYSLEKDLCLMKMSSQFLPAAPQKIVIQNSHILAALSNGVLCRTHIDELTGALSEARTRVMTDGQPLQMFPVTVNKTKAVVLTGNRHFLGFFSKSTGRFELQHLAVPDVDTLEFVADFGDGRLLLFDSLRFLKVCTVRLSPDGFVEQSLKLANLGRKLLVNPVAKNLIVVQSQNRTLPDSAQKLVADSLLKHYKIDGSLANGFSSYKDLKFAAKPDRWVSSIQILNPVLLQETCRIDFEANEHILETKVVSFRQAENETFLLVSLVSDYHATKQTFTESRVALYMFEKEGTKLRFFHDTRMDAMVTAAASFRGRLLLAVGGYIRLYQLGRKQFLKKGEYKNQYGMITGIKVSNDRVYLSDSRNSVFLLRFKEGKFTELADDVLPRYVTAFALLDHHTVSLTDKFGNLSVLRLPPDSEQELSEDFLTYKFKWESGYLNGAPVKFDQLCSFYLQSTPTALQKVTFASSQEEALLIADVHGAFRLMIPFEFKAELDFFKHLELYLRLPQDGYDFLTDRDHLLYRSYHSSAKGVIDGDLCECFLSLPPANQGLIAQNLDRTRGEIIKKLEDFRFKII